MTMTTATIFALNFTLLVFSLSALEFVYVHAESSGDGTDQTDSSAALAVSKV
jgi:hypothetical protein